MSNGLFYTDGFAACGGFVDRVDDLDGAEAVGVVDGWVGVIRTGLDASADKWRVAAGLSVAFPFLEIAGLVALVGNPVERLVDHLLKVQPPLGAPNLDVRMIAALEVIAGGHGSQRAVVKT